jgi:superfamily I DNA and/or RNA helicase
MNAYFSWFFYLLNQEFNANIALINEIHLPANKRELKGNCIANLILESQVLIWLGRCPECFSNLTNSEKICTNCGSHIDIISGFQNNNDIIRNIGFRKENNQELTSTRLRKGDYVVLTPQEFLPLTSESIPATIKNITTNQIELDLAFEIEKKHPIFNTKFYRIDLTTSNYAINLQKQTLDELIRGSLQSDKEHLRKLRDIVINNYTPKDRNIDKKWLIFKKDSKFDMSQQEAIQKALSEQHLCMIQGPPGTGKTTVIVEIILRTLKYLQDQDDLKKKRNAKKYFHYPILITAYTNKAVDNIISKLLDADSTIRVIRIGNITGIDDARILSHTLESICSTEINLENGQKITTIDPLKANLILKNAQVIATTTTSAGHVVLNQAHFNTVILDEAGQIIEPSALTALIKGERYIIVGDHMQLPPINIGQLEELPKEVEGFTDLLAFKPEQGLGVSIFERLARYYLNTPSYHLLTRQYRMNQVISDFISQFFYQGRLEVGQEKIAKQNLRDLFTDLKMNYESWNDHSKFAMIFNPDTPMVFLDTAKINAEDSHEKIETKDLDSIYNDTEAKIISFFIGLLIEELYQSQKSNFDIVISEIVMQIGVISGYRAQNQRLHQHLQELLEKIVMNWKFNSIAKKEEILEKLHRITIDTVDRFQGGEREIIFYSFVDSNSTYSLRSLNTELRRINVALSRAKKKLIIVGNSKTLKVKTSQDSPVIKEAKLFYQRMIDYIQIHSGYMELDLSLIEQMGI